MKLGLIIIVVFVVIEGIKSNEPKTKSYSGYKGIRIWLKTDEQVKIIQKLENESKIRFWDEVTISRPMDLIVPHESLELFRKQVLGLGIQTRILVEDLQQLIDNEAIANQLAKNRSAMRTPEGFASPDTYFARYSEIVAWLRQLQVLHPTLAQAFEAGSSYLGQTIYGIKIGTSGTGKTNILIEACIHAREWLACATTNWIINRLLKDSTTNPTVQQLLREYNWYFVPVSNPDGYDYTFTTDRYHRKTLSPNLGLDCLGADPNRNFDNHWNEQGSSPNFCSDIYAGKYAHSEVETLSIANLMTSLRPKISFSIHAFSQLWLLPYGWTRTLPPTYYEMLRVANIGAAALEAVNGRRFQVGNIASTIYLSSGSSADYAYDNAGVPYACGLEVRPAQGAIDGFNPPPSQIEPSGREVYAGLLAYVQNVQ